MDLGNGCFCTPGVGLTAESTQGFTAPATTYSSVTAYDQKKIKSKSFFNFLIRVEVLWVSDSCLGRREEVCLSWGPTEAGVDFDMKKFSGKISF